MAIDGGTLNEPRQSFDTILVLDFGCVILTPLCRTTHKGQALNIRI